MAKLALVLIATLLATSAVTFYAYRSRDADTAVKVEVPVTTTLETGSARDGVYICNFLAQPSDSEINVFLKWVGDANFVDDPNNRVIRDLIMTLTI